jgi:hypothetical protein
MFGDEPVLILILWGLTKPVIMEVKKDLFWAREACALPIILKKLAMAESWEDHRAKILLN